MEQLSDTELHYLAMNIVGRALEELGWEFLFINSNINKNPQFVCLSPDKGKHFIIVRAVLGKVNPDIYDHIFMMRVKRHADEQNAKAYWAGVGLAHPHDPLLPLQKNAPYKVVFNGLLEIK